MQSADYIVSLREFTINHVFIPDENKRMQEDGSFKFNLCIFLSVCDCGIAATERISRFWFSLFLFIIRINREC